MALADYSTAEEKIAALKCAMIDPDLIYFEDGVLNVSETIHLVTNVIILNSVEMFNWHDNMGLIPPKISSGNTVSPAATANGAAAFLYVKDGDIDYSDPITLYKNRLVNIMESEYHIASGLTVGADGALIITCAEDSLININGLKIGGSWGFTTIPFYLPLKSGYVITTQYSNDPIGYIDLPSDW